MTAEEFVDAVNPASAGSWAECELKAVACGLPTGTEFCRLALVAGTLVHSMTRIVAEGILSSPSWECVRRDEGIVDDVFQLFPPCGRHFHARLSCRREPSVQKLAADFIVALEAKERSSAAAPAGGYIRSEARRYVLLDAIERRFPILPVKYYAANAQRIHETDENFAVWIKLRLAKRARTSEVFGKIYNSMAAAFADNHFTAAVFMK